MIFLVFAMKPDTMKKLRAWRDSCSGVGQKRRNGFERAYNSSANRVVKSSFSDQSSI